LLTKEQEIYPVFTGPVQLWRVARVAKAPVNPRMPLKDHHRIKAVGEAVLEEVAAGQSRTRILLSGYQAHHHNRPQERQSCLQRAQQLVGAAGIGEEGRGGMAGDLSTRSLQGHKQVARLAAT
jgi:hypothetical protein